MKLYILLLCAAVISLTTSIAGQEKSFPDSKTKTAFEQKTSAVIEEILLEMPMLESKENRITVYTMMTDLLWSRDEKRARELAAETAELLRSELSSAADARSALQFPRLRFGNLRRDFLVILTARDAALAQELKLYTLPRMPKFPATSESEKIQVRNWNNDERDLEQKIAFQIASKNVADAQKMASKSLALGISDESLNVLRRFQIRNAATADAFAADLIEKLIASDFAKDDAAQRTAAMFLQQTDVSQGVFAMPRSCDCPTKPLNMDAQKVRALASKWLNHALSAENENINQNFLDLAPVLQKLIPEKNQAVQGKIDSIKKSDPGRFENAQLNEQIFDDKTTPEMLASMALKKQGNEKFQLYREAFIKAANKSKAALEKLLADVSAHPESEEKNWMLDQINANLSGKTAEDGDIDKALEMAQKVIAKDRRLGLLSFLALEFLEKGETGKARQISDEIAVLMDLKTKDKMPKAIVRYDIFSTVFRTFALVDAERAFTLLENVLPEAGDALTGRYSVSNFSSANADKRIDLQTLLKQNAYVLDLYAEPLKKLTEFDFERTKNLSKYFSKPELSVASKLLLAQSLTGRNLGFGFVRDREEMIVFKN